MNPKSTPQRISPHLIRMDLNTQARLGIDKVTVREYIELMEDGVMFPPIVVFFDIITLEYILADGFHRLLAHLQARPNDQIAIEQYLGTVEDARWFAICANLSHGLKRSNEDKRNAVTLALLHPNGYGLSNRQIAQRVGVTHPLVSAIRKEMERDSRLEAVTSRIGKDGRTYNVKNIGKTAENPACCGDCGHYEPDRCLLDGENYDPTNPGCQEFCVLPPPEDRDEGVFKICKYDSNDPPEVEHRPERRHKGDYVHVPLDRSSPDRAACEIRLFLGENYLAALAQSALRILQDDD